MEKLLKLLIMIETLNIDELKKLDACRDAVGDSIDERHLHVDADAFGVLISAEAFDDVFFGLTDDFHVADDNDQREEDDH